MIGQSSYEGYRNLQDSDGVILSKVITSHLPQGGTVSTIHFWRLMKNDCTQHVFCKNEYKLLDNVVSEE